ncbi:BC2 protein [Giardia lamblia P15]|uniref:BC2 protein n=2 Tax=Giardia intestinalis TaxID=5741 RepID=E1F0I8_GIAIA|nr:BC2 protein [Giardia lamblia P15]
MLTITRERLFPRSSGTTEGPANVRVIGVHFGPCVLDIGIEVSPRFLLVKEVICRLRSQHCIFSEILLYDHQHNKSTTLLSSLPSTSRILSAAISPNGHLLAISTVTRDWGARYQYTTTVTNLKQQGLTASIRLRSPADVCFPGDSSHLLLLTYIPVLTKVFIKRTRLQTQQLIIHPMTDSLHVFGEALHVQGSPPYVLVIELPTAANKYTDVNGLRHMYTRLLGQLGTRGSTQLLVLRLYRWYNGQLNEIRRLPITIPARYKVHPFPSRGSIQCKSVLIDLVTIPQPIVIFSCHSLGCTMIKICACLTASIFTFSLATPLQKPTEDALKTMFQTNAPHEKTLPTERDFTSPSNCEHVTTSLHKFILLVHANYLLFIQPFSLSAAQLVIVALPSYGPMYIAYSALLPFQICNSQAYYALKQFSKLSPVSTYISKHQSQAQYLLHYMALSLVGLSKEQILADMHTVRTTIDRILEYVTSPMSGSGGYADTPFGFISYTELANVYIHKRVRQIAGLPEAPEMDVEVLCGWSGLNKEDYPGVGTDSLHPASLLISLITVALSDSTSGTSTFTRTTLKTTDSPLTPRTHQDVSATNLSTPRRLTNLARIPSAMHTCQTDYTDEHRNPGGLSIPPIVVAPSTFTDFNIVHSEVHNANDSSSDFLTSTVITSVADTTAFDEPDEQPSQKRLRPGYKELPIDTLVSKRKVLFSQFQRTKKRQKHLGDLDSSMTSVVSKKSMSSKLTSQSTPIAEAKDLEQGSLKSDCASLSLEIAYLNQPISGTINFPMQSIIDLTSLLKYIPQPSYTSYFRDIDEICHLSRSWRYSVIPSYYSSTEEWSNKVTFTVFDMLLQRQLDLTVDLSRLAINLCYPHPKDMFTCLYEARLLRINHKLVLLYHRYSRLLYINLLTIASDINIPSSSNCFQFHSINVEWWKRLLNKLRMHCILEYSALVSCLLEKVSISLKASTPNNSNAIQFSLLVLKGILLNNHKANASCPCSLAVNLYSNPLHVFLHSVTQDKLVTSSPWSKCTTMYAVHSYLHISNTLEHLPSVTQLCTGRTDATNSLEQFGMLQQNIPIYDQSIEKNIRFGIGRAIELYKYMSTDSICPAYTNNYAKECLVELNTYVSNITALDMITQSCLPTFSGFLTQHSDNQLSIEDDVEVPANTSMLHVSDDLITTYDCDGYKQVWCNSAIYKAFVAIVERFYLNIADSFFTQLYADVISICEACIGIDTNFSIEELNVVISICESLNLNLMGHRSTSRVLNRTLSLLYSKFSDSMLQEMIRGYL